MLGAATDLIPPRAVKPSPPTGSEHGKLRPSSACSPGLTTRTPSPSSSHLVQTLLTGVLVVSAWMVCPLSCCRAVCLRLPLRSGVLGGPQGVRPRALCRRVFPLRSEFSEGKQRFLGSKRWNLAFSSPDVSWVSLGCSLEEISHAGGPPSLRSPSLMLGL